MLTPGRTMGFRAGEEAYQPIGADFDGTNDLLQLNADLTGASDGPNLAISFWVNFDALSGDHAIVLGDGIRVRLYHRSSLDALWFFAVDPSGSTLFDIRSTLTTPTGQWLHVAAKRSDAGVQLVIDETDVANVVANNAGNIDLTPGGWSIGGDAAQGRKLDGALADLWMDARDVDWSDTPTMRLFRDADGNPVDLGADGSTPFSAVPLVFMSGDLSNWPTNKGAGGGFTEIGALGEVTGPAG